MIALSIRNHRTECCSISSRPREYCFLRHHQTRVRVSSERHQALQNFVLSENRYMSLSTTNNTAMRDLHVLQESQYIYVLLKSAIQTSCVDFEDLKWLRLRLRCRRTDKSHSSMWHSYLPFTFQQKGSKRIILRTLAIQTSSQKGTQSYDIGRDNGVLAMIVFGYEVAIRKM